MYDGYFVEPIGLRTIERAFPLARVAAPRLTEQEWRNVCRSRGQNDETNLDDREDVVVACNTAGYVKGLCIYSVRDHETYGRLIDVPIFVVASAADGEGVAASLLKFLRAKCDRCVCSGIRFWTLDSETWSRRLERDYIARGDHGQFMPALATAAEIDRALRIHGIEGQTAIDRLSR